MEWFEQQSRVWKAVHGIYRHFSRVMVSATAAIIDLAF